jgi:hypothetical protein
MIIFDRRAGLLEVSGDRRAAVIVMEGPILDFMINVFDRSWRDATPFQLPLKVDAVSSASDSIQQSIVALLAQGFTGRAVARRLGISERTCQRHLAEAMAALDAKTRFQAGYRYREGIDDSDL